MRAGRRSLTACLLALAASGAGGAASAHASDSSARRGDAVATVNGATAVLADHGIERHWRMDSNGVVTTALLDGATNWSAPASPDFTLTLNEISTSSTLGWTLIDATAKPLPDDPSRPDAGPGVEIVFRYAAGPAAPPAGAPAPLDAAPLELDRSYSLHPGSRVIGVSSTLVNRTPAALRVGSYSLVELTSPAAVSADVQAYHGGSDWRDDYRTVTHESAGFDDEGQVVRFDDGTGSGWFMVGQRRSGSMSRVGHNAGGRTWVGVDSARDAFDWGPLMTSPPNYNRQDNPVYPAPVRERTVAPGETLDLGRAYIGVYHGGAGQASANFVTDFAAHEMPAFARSIGLNTFHPWSHGPGVGDANLRQQVDAAAALGLESFMIDDSWQGGTGGVSGDWQFNPARFADSNHDGVPDIVDHIHSKGLKLGLWMSPVEFNPNSQTYAAHPDWACAPTGDVTAQVGGTDPGLGVWDVNNPGFRSYLNGVIDRLIATDGVSEFKFDFQTWVDCPPHDYLDYEDGFVSLVREMQARHPGVTFEFDETNDQRMWPFESAALGPSWFDNGHLHGSDTTPDKYLHDIWSTAPWLPPSSIGFGNYDNSTLGATYGVDYLMPIALLGHITFWTDLTQISAADAAETSWWLSWYRDHRADLGGLVYEDTSADPLDGSSWAAFQPWSEDHGYLFAFRQGGAADTQTVALQGVDPGVTYHLTDVRTGVAVGDFTGAQLRSGLALTLAQRYTARVLSIRPL
jgi:Melibiase